MSETAEHDPDILEALPPGAAIGGYAVRRMIGHGGFGITYEAHNRVTGKEVAIKEFFPSSMARRASNSRLIYSKVNSETIAWALRKFEETTTTLCGLEHPNIVKVHDYVPANETGYMIMELLDGETLEHWLKSRAQPPSLDELQPLVDPVMEALTYVHGRGLIHRDIAPDNILITRSGRPVLIDFGSVSRDLSDARQKAMSSTIGLAKRHYTAPEQTRAKARPTPEADVYSMGAVLYRALTGAAPADGQDRVDAIFHEKATDPYAPLMKRVPAGCTARAAQAIDRALAVNPEHRLRAIADLHAAMAPAGAAPAAARMPARWLAAAALAVVVAGLGGALAGSRWAMDDNRAGQAALDGQRKELEAARADIAKQSNDVAKQSNDIAKQRSEVAEQRGEIAKQRDDLATTKADVERRGAAIEAAKAEVARQRDSLGAVDAETARGKAEVEQAKEEIARQRALLDAGRAGNDRDGAAMVAAKADLDRQRDALRERGDEVERQRQSAAQAKADLDQERQTLQAAQADLAQQRDRLAADKGRLEQDRAQLGQGARDDTDRLAKQLSDARAATEDEQRRRAAAESDVGQLRDLARTAAAENDRLREQAREKDDALADLKAENARLRRVAEQPPAREAASAPSASASTALWRKAREATVIFYDKHSYSEGGSLDDLLALYPSGQKITVNGTQRTGREQIAALEQYFKQKSYTVFDIRVEPDSLDFGGCQTLENCVVKGRTQSTYRTADSASPRGGPSSFCLRFNLRGSVKVLAEAATRPGKDPSCE